MSAAAAAGAARSDRPDEAGARFDLGGVVVAFASPSGEWVTLLGDRFRGFETAAEPSFRVRYLARPGTADAPAAARGPMPPRLRRRHGEAEIELLGPGFVARADLDRGVATVEGPLAVYPVDMVLRELLPALTAGVILHCALLGDGTATWACSGASGSGKSTLAALLEEHALCDELAHVAEHDGRFHGCSLPYWEARPGGAPLAGIVMLRHGAAHRKTRLAPGRALRALAAEVVWPLFSETAMERRFATLGRLVESVPVWQLEFAPRADVWDVITAEA
jgi:hypothetical protein